MCLTIGRSRVGRCQPLFVIAEIGLNHGGSVEEALRLVDAAARAGASAVKLQSLRGATLVAPACPPPAHVACASLQAFFETFELDEDAHARVAARARAHGLAFMSTPFDEAAVAMLERIGCDAYKIASGDLTHHRLIATAAATGKPLVMSTGMSEPAEIAAALACARDAGAGSIALLHCVSAYPVPAGQENLAAIATLARAFDVPVGLSDHGTNPEHVLLAVALGASLLEKHLILDASSDAIDAAVSATPEALGDLIAAAARAQAALGSGQKAVQPAEAPNQEPSRRALYATRDLAAGAVVTTADCIALRPAAGLAASAWQRLVGTTLRRPVAAGAPFLEADVDARQRSSEAQDAA